MICGVLLAAGGARRFGGDKLLAPLPDGTPVAIAAARNLMGGVNHAVVVVRPGNAALARLLIEAGLEVAVCADAERGMGTSLAWGVSHARDAQGWIVTLADMPFIQPCTITALARMIGEGASLAAPYFTGRRGHPVAFGRKYLRNLLELDGDQGARELLVRYSDELARLDTDDPGILRDIDTPQQLAQFGVV